MRIFIVGQSENGGLRTLGGCCFCWAGAGVGSDDDMVVGYESALHHHVARLRSDNWGGALTHTPSKNFWSILFCKQCCSKNRYRSLRTKKLLAFRLQLWGKSPEIQSMSSTISRKATAFKRDGTGRGWRE